MEEKRIVVITVFLWSVFFSFQVNAFPGCVKNPIDITFLLDGSGSVGPQRFDLVKEFVQKLLLRLNVGKEGTKVALMQFSKGEGIRIDIEMNDYEDLKSMSDAIGNIEYHYGGLQETGVALKMTRMKVFNDHTITDRQWAKNVVVLITEGPSTYPKKALNEAKLLKDNGVRFVAIGVGNRITTSGFRSELEGLASSFEDVFFSSDENLMKLIEMLSERLCPNILETTSVYFTSTQKSPTTTSQTTSTWKNSTTSISSENDKNVSTTKFLIQATTMSPTRTNNVPTITVTSILMKTSTVFLTSYISVSPPCGQAVEKSMQIPPPTMSTKTQSPPLTRTPKTKDQNNEKDEPAKNDNDHISSAELSGEHLTCFSCEFDEDVAKEFPVKCSKTVCARDQSYCANAVLQQHGRRFIKKSCASSQYCNGTLKQCVDIFQHSADFTECKVDCCNDKLCNPYNVAAPTTLTSLLLFFPVSIIYLLRHI